MMVVRWSEGESDTEKKITSAIKIVVLLAGLWTRCNHQAVGEFTGSVTGKKICW